MKLMLGNLLFGVVIFIWYRCYGDNSALLVPGIWLAVGSFLVGTCMGFFLQEPKKKPIPRPARRASTPENESFVIT